MTTGMSHKLDVLVEDAEEDNEDQDEDNVAVSPQASNKLLLEAGTLEKADSKHINLEKIAS